MLFVLIAGLACNSSAPRRSPLDTTSTARPGFPFVASPTDASAGTPTDSAPTEAAPPTQALPPPTDLPNAPPSPPPEVSATFLPPGPAATPYPSGGLETATAGPPQVQVVLTPEPEAALPPFTYWVQPGDTLSALAARFGVSPEQINAGQPLPNAGLLPFNLQLAIPNLLGVIPYPSALLPDSAVVNSPAAAGFQVAAFAAQAGGYLSTYQEALESGEVLSGAEIVERVALETSVNPQLLLTFLEYRSHWVLGQPADPERIYYPIGFYVPDYFGLYKELSLTAKFLNIGYYGWRQGTLTELEFPDGARLRLNPSLNPGSVALQVLVSKFYREAAWLEALFGTEGLLALHTRLFGDPWQAAAAIGPLFPPRLAQPSLELPFVPGQEWKLSSGPHLAWTTGTPRGALDFAPTTGEERCVVSSAWVTASAAGVVVRSEGGVVSLDLDGDGREGTGWVLVYLHLAGYERVAAGTWAALDTPLGHPSCEGGTATGTHVHLARKYNGEWLAADGPLPLVLSGWVAHAALGAYSGTLEKDGVIVSYPADITHGFIIVR